VLVFANNRQPALQAAISAAMVAPIFGWLTKVYKGCRFAVVRVAGSYMSFFFSRPGATVDGDSHILQQAPHISLALPPPAPSFSHW